MHDCVLDLNKASSNVFSSSTTHVMSLYECLKVHTLMTQSVCDCLVDLQSTCDNLASSGHHIDEMQQISIILNGVKG